MDQQASIAAEPSPVSSFMSRVTGVFTSPGELFHEVASAPVQTTSWLLPYLLSLLVVFVVTFSLFSSPSLRQQILEPQQQKMQKAVEEGKMTQENYDRATAMMESPAMFLAIGIIGSCVFVSLAAFGIPLILWLAARFLLKASASYKKMLEVYGLTSLVGILGGIATLLLMNLFDSVHASLGLSLVVMNGFDPENFGHKLLASLNLFSLWQVALAGLGVASASGRATKAGMGIAFGLWAIWVIVSSALGWAVR